MSMQMDAEFQKEQNGTLFVWVGALEGGLGGGWSLRVVHPRNWTYLPKIKIKHPPATGKMFHVLGAYVSYGKMSWEATRTMKALLVD
jgi:hypothetical protein